MSDEAQCPVCRGLGLIGTHEDGALSSLVCGCGKAGDVAAHRRAREEYAEKVRRAAWSAFDRERYDDGHTGDPMQAALDAADLPRLLAIESAAHALCDAVGPGGVRDGRAEVAAAMERLEIACVRSR